MDRVAGKHPLNLATQQNFVVKAHLAERTAAFTCSNADFGFSLSGTGVEEEVIAAKVALSGGSLPEVTVPLALAAVGLKAAGGMADLVVAGEVVHLEEVIRSLPMRESAHGF